MKKFTTVGGFADYYKASEVDAKIAELEQQLETVTKQRNDWIEKYTKRTESVAELEKQRDELAAHVEDLEESNDRMREVLETYAELEYLSNDGSNAAKNVLKKIRN